MPVHTAMLTPESHLTCRTTSEAGNLHRPVNAPCLALNCAVEDYYVLYGKSSETHARLDATL